VGKSSLINALVGYQRSIVFDEPGTTRDVVTAETALDGWPIQFIDTAGLRDSDADDLEAAGIALARQQLDAADLRLLVLDTSQPRNADDERLLDEWTDALVIANKCDLPSAWLGPMDVTKLPGCNPEGARFDSPGHSPGIPVPPDESAPPGRNSRTLTEASRPVGASNQSSNVFPGLRPGLSNQTPLGLNSECRLHPNQIPPGAINVSARTRAGLDELIAAIVARLVPVVPPAGTAVPVTLRQIKLLRRIASASVQHDATTTACLCDELLA
jgi:small GTP-binding protein